MANRVSPVCLEHQVSNNVKGNEEGNSAGEIKRGKDRLTEKKAGLEGATYSLLTQPPKLVHLQVHSQILPAVIPFYENST